MKPKPIILSSFGGIAPRFGNNLKPGAALVAENCDMADGKLKPLKDHLLIEANTTGVNSMHYHADDWYTGDDRHYLTWPINANNLLVYLDGGVAYKEVAGVTATLGHDPPGTPVISNVTVRKTLTDYAIYEWRQSVNEDELYCILRGTLDNIAVYNFPSLTGWVDGDNGLNAASTAVTHLTRTTAKFVSGDAGAANYARRTRDVGTLPNKYRFAITYYASATGNVADSDFFRIEVSKAGVKLSVNIALDGMFIYDGAAWNEIGTNIVTTGAWQTAIFEVDATTPASATCKVSLGATSQTVSCAYTGAFTEGEVQLTQWGVTTANRTIYVDSIKIGDWADPGLAEPDAIKIDGVDADQGTIGSLAENEWDHGNSDSLGFDTVYMNFEPPAATAYTLTLSTGGGTGEYYIRKKYGTNPNFGDISYLMIDGIKLTEGSEPGALSPSEYSFGDIDSIGFTTIYFRLSDSSNPNNWVHTIKIVTTTKREVTINTTHEDVLDVVHEINPGNVVGSIVYTVTTTRNVGGHTDESGPSTQSNYVWCVKDQVLINKPTITEPYVTHWNIYRFSAGVPLFVASVPVATLTYQDNTTELSLGAMLSTEYTSDQGNIITFAKAPTGLDGLSSDLYAGMIFAYDGTTLRWCEPGFPDAWPWHYSMNLPSTIKRALPLASTLALLCESGPMRVDGTHPEQLMPSDVLGEEPCIGTAACKTSKGIVYLSDSGLVVFNMLDTIVVSDKWFDEKWFTENVDPDTAFLAENDGSVYLFHSGGVLVYDSNISPPWRTLDLIATAAYKRTDNGVLYYLDSAGIQQMHGAATDLTYSWKSGDLVPAAIVDTEWISVETIGSGTVTVESFVDGASAATKALDFTTGMHRDRISKLPENSAGRALQIAFDGTGTITEAKVEFSL